MPCVFISHAEEDSALATRFADALERQGYSTWYFERDSIPGISYLEQTAEVIADRPAILLLISEHALGSFEVSAELQKAYRMQCRFIPVLVDVTHGILDDRRPEWSLILGTTASIRLDSSDFPTVVGRIMRGLTAIGIAPSTLPSRSQDKPDVSGDIHTDRVLKIWASDANQIDIRDLDDVVFRNRVIDDFLSKTHRTFLSASKGLGKTLLLTYKRRLLQDTYRESERARDAVSVHFVPEGKPYLDFMSDLAGSSGDHKHFLSSLANCKKCWSFAFRVSAVSFSPYVMSGHDTVEVDRFPQRMREWLHGHRIEPTLVFKELVSHSVKDINQLTDWTETFLEQKFRAIHSGLFFFVDKADQAMGSLPRDAWVHVQAGMIEAAWNAMNANNHVKIFASIRQEAFANYESDIKANLFGATATISYTRHELRSLLDQLTRCYEGRSSFKDFVHVCSVLNPKSRQLEDAFQYLARHSLGRPRDLVIIASELSRHQDDLGEPSFRRIVSETSSRVIAANVFDENLVFLDSLRDRPNRLRFLSLLPKNILSREDAYRISAEFNGIDLATLNMFGRDSSDIHHPFWELYGIGLLGVLSETDDGQGELVQRFKQPTDISQDAPTDLPDSPYYLIHPSLEALIRRQRRSAAYHVSNYVIAGHGVPWLPHYGALASAEGLLEQVDDRELRDQVANWLGRLVTRSVGGTVRGNEARPASEWKSLSQRLEVAGHDELLLWLDDIA